MPRIVVDNRVRVFGLEPHPDLLARLRAAFTYPNPEVKKLKALGKRYGNLPEHVSTHSDEVSGVKYHSFPRGGLARVLKMVGEAGLTHSLEDRRTRGEGPGSRIPDPLQVPYPFQDEAVARLTTAQTGLLRSGTGSGKTSVAITLVSRLKVAALVVVADGGLFDQWVMRVGKELGIPESEVGVIRGPKRRLAPVTIAMQQSLARRVTDREREYFGCVVVDEVQRAPARTVYSVIDQFPAKWRVGVSADERRKDGKEFYTYDLFGDVAMDIDREKLVRDGFILDVDVRVVPTHFRADWYGHPTEGGELDVKRLVDEVVASRERNELVLGYAERAARGGDQVVVMSQRVEHCQLLARELVARGLRVGLLLGGAENRAEYRRSVQALRDGSIQVGVGTYQAMGTGLDIPAVGVAVCATPIASNRQYFNQVRGRVCRCSPGKPQPRLFYLWDWRVHGEKHLANLVKWNPSCVALSSAGEWIEGREALNRLRARTRGTA